MLCYIALAVLETTSDLDVDRSLTKEPKSLDFLLTNCENRKKAERNNLLIAESIRCDIEEKGNAK